MKSENSRPSGSTQRQAEAVEVRYIRLLRQFPADGSPLFTNENDPVEDVAAFAELLRDEYISGCTLENEVGRVIEIANMTITTRGRILLADLERQQSLQTSVGIIRASRWGFYKWFFSTVGSFALGYIFRYYTE